MTIDRCIGRSSTSPAITYDNPVMLFPGLGPPRRTSCKAITKPVLTRWCRVDRAAGSSVVGEAMRMWRGDDDMAARALHVRRGWRMQVLRGIRK
jgi:hypothetical protein